MSISFATRRGSAAAFMGASILAIAIAAPAFAQTDPSPSDEVVVTGTRIARDPNLTEPLPVQTVDAATFRLSGEPDLVDTLNDIPALLTATTAEGSIDGVFAAGVGQAILNLRGLGAERTLVLIDGQRHVGGVAGSAIVDITAIPAGLVDRVEVLTGGASQIYGADAVTGVVNFILKDDFDGFSVNASGGISSKGDGERFTISGIAGKNFADDRGNVTLAVDYSQRNDIFNGDRDFIRNNGQARNLPNPARRFQLGDISAGSTPNFAAFFDPSAGRFSRGFAIPNAASFIADYTAEFGSAPTLTAAELALIDRAANSPSRAILPQPNFSVSSNRGVIAPGDFSSPALDLNGNGTDDCLDSFVGFNSSLDFSSSFGILGGCWVVNDDGSVRPYQDGLIVGNFNQFGGDGIQDNFDADTLVPELQNIVGNFRASYELTPNLTAFVDAKMAYQHVEFGGPLNTFYDLLTIAPDNPFIPTELAGVAAATGGLFVTRDPTDLGPNITTNESRTYRLVTGLKGENDAGFQYGLTGNYGRTDRRQTDRNRVILDRFFAAVDATTDGAGNPVCRSDLDPSTVSPTTPFDIPLFDFGYFTFNPGDGQCRPANILGGPNSISQEAVDFITTTTLTRVTLEQFVVNGIVSGNFDKLFKLPGGSVGFATGFEYRDESSSTIFDPLEIGVLPVTTPDGQSGQLIRDIAGFRQTSLVFDPASLINNAGGSFSVWEAFGEVDLPILRDLPFAKELTVRGGVRFSEYSTVGSTFSWGVAGTWAPIKDIAFRASYAVPIRAPNIDELFAPDQGAFFRPIDPCDQGEIDALITAGDPRGPVRAANCLAAGIPAGFTDPLSARFSGVTGGNPDLQEETARTFSVGVVLQPSFLEGFSLTADYWTIEIENAIAAVSAQDIVDNCYDSANFPNQFCDLFTRNSDPGSPQFNGFNFLRQSTVNFASLKAAGIDFQAAYQFDIGPNEFGVRLGGTWMDRLDRFFDPGDPAAVDPELGEIQRPVLAGNASLSYRRGAFGFGWQTQYQGKQGLRGVEIETFETIYGPAGIADRVFIHDLNASYDIGTGFQVYGGVNNITDRVPFITENAFPVSPLGRYFFLGVEATF